MFRSRRDFLGFFIGGSVLAFALIFGILGNGAPEPLIEHAAALSASSTGIVGNATPQITAVTLNNASSIILIANATKTVTVNFTVSDDNGCGGIFYGSGNVTTTLYRSDASSTCALASPTFNYLNCYYTATTTHNCSGANSTTTTANATATFDVWYFADATDASSTYASQNWLASVFASDASSTGSTTTESGMELLTLNALSLASSSLNYGTVPANTNTSGTNQTASVKNAGNSSATLQIAGTAMCGGGNCIPTSSQHYATSTFTYGGGEQELQEVATAVAGWLVGNKPLGTWATTTPYPTTINAMASFAYNGYIYVVGGRSNGEYISTVSFAPINASGSIGAWTTTTPYPSPIAYHPSFAYNGYIYVVGGRSDGEYTSTVSFAPINASGSIGAWTATTPYPSDIQRQFSFAYNGFAYVVGGYIESLGIGTTTVRYAPISATGSIGQWATTTPSLVACIYGSTFFYKGYIYHIDCWVPGVYYAPISATGSIGQWTTTSPYPASYINIPSSFAYNDFVYVIGGWLDANTSTVAYAPISSNGSIGVWALSTAYPATIAYHSSFVNNGLVYVVGGTANDAYTSTVRYAPLPTKDTYWGLGVPAGTASSTYTGLVTYTSVFSP